MEDQNSDVSIPQSLHARLEELKSNLNLVQKDLVRVSGPDQGIRLSEISDHLKQLCAESINQVLGELFLTRQSHYRIAKPLYVAASLIELIRRYNNFKPDAPIETDRREQLILSGLCFNLKQLDVEDQSSENNEQLSLEELNKQRQDNPKSSADILQAAGLNHPVLLDAVNNYVLTTENPSNDALLLRTPFIYAKLAMLEAGKISDDSFYNPTREFARMFANQELNPVFGGIFLKINGLAPIGSIMNFDSQEKGVIVAGPGETDISSSTVRMLTNKRSVQLVSPGQKYLLNEMPMKQNGLSDHHMFSWTRFDPHLMWE